MGWIWLILLACAVAVLVAAEWPRVSPRVSRFGLDGRQQRRRSRRKSQLTLLNTEETEDDFAASVERDLAQLPTTRDRDG